MDLCLLDCQHTVTAALGSNYVLIMQHKPTVFLSPHLAVCSGVCPLCSSTKTSIGAYQYQDDGFYSPIGIHSALSLSVGIFPSLLLYVRHTCST
jgi:hypothetical protein